MLSTVAQADPELRPKLGGRSKRSNIQAANYNNADAAYTSERRASGVASDHGPELLVGAGKMYGFNSLVTDGSATVVDAEVRLMVTRNLFVPIGVSRWDGSLNIPASVAAVPGLAATISTLAVDTGLGYYFHLTRRLAMPLGTRLGWYRMDLAVKADGVDPVKVATMGKVATPFTGFSLGLTDKVALMYEARLPLFIPNDSGTSDDSDNSKKGRGNSMPSYQLLMLSWKL